MGLDLALAGVVFFTAIRGWFKGFMAQAIRLGALVSAVYIAAPVRDELKIHALEYLPTIRPDLIDRLLWWVSLVTCYVLIVGVASLALAISRRQTYGNADRGRGDQFAGFGLGLIKGSIVVVFLLSTLQKHGSPYLSKLDFGQDQIKDSLTWKWNSEYQPADKIWALPPVRLLVQQVQQMGFNPPASADADADAAGEEEGNGGKEVSARTDARSPKLQWAERGRKGRQAAVEPDGSTPFDLDSLPKQLQVLTETLNRD